MHAMLIGSLVAALLGTSCSRGAPSTGSVPPEARDASGAATSSERAQAPTEDEARYARRRERLVHQLRAEGITDARVLAALSVVPRHLMVAESERELAYADQPLPIGHGQTISQPYVVALMTQLADVQPNEKVLEIGTGSGYQAAVLAELGARVFSIEVRAPLGEQARRVLDQLGYADRVQTRIGDGYRGWDEEAPFDAIVITAAPPVIPEPLTKQLALHGKLVAPIGEDQQELTVLTKTSRGLERSRSLPVRFVPMTGEAQDER